MFLLLFFFAVVADVIAIVEVISVVGVLVIAIVEVISVVGVPVLVRGGVLTRPRQGLASF